MENNEEKSPSTTSDNVTIWNDPETAPKDGTLLRLLVLPSQDHDDPITSFEDSREPYQTIGFNMLKHTLEDVWQFVGWDWCNDSFIDGHGSVIGWLPFEGKVHGKLFEFLKNNLKLEKKVDWDGSEVAELFLTNPETGEKVSLGSVTVKDGDYDG